MENTPSAEKQDTPHVATYTRHPDMDEAIAAVPLVEASRRPARVGYLTNYSFHIWYQIVIELLRRRGAQYGIEIEVADANLSVANQIEQARGMVKRVDALILTPAATEGLEEILAIAAEANVPVVIRLIQCLECRRWLRYATTMPVTISAHGSAATSRTRWFTPPHFGCRSAGAPAMPLEERRVCRRRSFGFSRTRSSSHR